MHSHRDSTTSWWAVVPPAARWRPDCRKIPGRTVCLLEAGGSGKSVFINVPGAIVMAQRSASLNWRFQSVPQPQLNGRRISVPRGRGLGGSALINGMVYFRGNPRDYDAWAAAGATGWSYREVLPYFRKSEHNENFGPGVYHGRGGPMNVRSVTRPESSQLFFLRRARRSRLHLPR